MARKKTKVEAAADEAESEAEAVADETQSEAEAVADETQSEAEAVADETQSEAEAVADEGTEVKHVRVAGTSIPETNTIAMCEDFDGNKYGGENNPKRGKSSERFAQYRDGMTVGDALSAGITSADLKYDILHNFIHVEGLDELNDEGVAYFKLMKEKKEKREAELAEKKKAAEAEKQDEETSDEPTLDVGEAAE